jgi:hypothetical protein
MRQLRERVLDVLWPWGRIRRLRNALTQALADNEVLHNRLKLLTDRDERGRFKKS